MALSSQFSFFFHKATLLCVLKNRAKTAGESEVLPVLVLGDGSPMNILTVFDDFTLASNILKLNESLPLFRVSSIVTASKLSKYGVYFWSVFSCIQAEYRKIRTRNNTVFGHFSRSESYAKILPLNKRNKKT